MLRPFVVKRYRARPWVILLSLGWLCARRSRARFHLHRSAQGHDCVATSVHLDMEAAPLQGHPLGHRSALEPGVSRQGHWGVGAPTFLFTPPRRPPLPSPLGDLHHAGVTGMGGRLLLLFTPPRVLPPPYLLITTLRRVKGGTPVAFLRREEGSPAVASTAPTRSVPAVASIARPAGTQYVTCTKRATCTVPPCSTSWPAPPA